MISLGIGGAWWLVLAAPSLLYTLIHLICYDRRWREWMITSVALTLVALTLWAFRINLVMVLFRDGQAAPSVAQGGDTSPAEPGEGGQS